MNRRVLLVLAILASLVALGLAGCDTPGGGPDITDTSNTIGDITTATTLETGKTYTVEGTVSVSAKLTIQPGTTIKFTTYSNYGSELIVTTAGQIEAAGTAAQPIVFTSSEVGSSTAAAPGDWGRILVQGSHSTFTYCTFAYAGNGNKAALEIQASYATVTSCTFTDNVIALDASGALENTTVSANAFYRNTGGTLGYYPVAIDTNVAFDDSNTFTNAGGTVANTVQGIELDGNLSAALTLANTKAPYVVGGVPVVSAKLTIQPGVTVQFMTYSNYGAGLDVSSSGQIVAGGTAVSPITFTSVKDGSTMTPSRMDWGGITLLDGSNASTFSYCDFLYNGNGDLPALSLGTTVGTSVTNCTFTHVVYGIDARYVDASTSVPTVGSTANTFNDSSLADFVP